MTIRRANAFVYLIGIKNIAVKVDSEIVPSKKDFLFESPISENEQDRCLA